MTAGISAVSRFSSSTPPAKRACTSPATSLSVSARRNAIAPPPASGFAPAVPPMISITKSPIAFSGRSSATESSRMKPR